MNSFYSPVIGLIITSQIFAFTLTDTQDRSVEVEIVQIEKNVVIFKRLGDRREMRLPLEKLSEDTRVKLLELQKQNEENAETILQAKRIEALPVELKFSVGNQTGGEFEVTLHLPQGEYNLNKDRLRLGDIYIVMDNGYISFRIGKSNRDQESRVKIMESKFLFRKNNMTPSDVKKYEKIVKIDRVKFGRYEGAVLIGGDHRLPEFGSFGNGQYGFSLSRSFQDSCVLNDELLETVIASMEING